MCAVYSQVKNMYSEDQDKFEFGSEYGRLEGQNCGNLDGFSGDWRRGLMPISQSLVLDGEKGELVKACGRIGKKVGASGAKTAAALKSHSEAERRRRERINAHLATLRGLVPSNEKMDKATLLSAVISQVKQLKETAAEAGEGFFIPTDSDEVRVEPLYENTGEGTFYFKASLCCDYRPEFLPELRQTLSALQVSLVKAEISSLGNRMKNVLFFSCARGEGKNDAESLEFLMSSVQQALSSILEKASLLLEYSPRTMLPNKKQRLSYFDSSSSSS